MADGNGIFNPTEEDTDQLTRYIRVSEGMTWLGIGKSKMYGLMNSGEVRSVHIGKSRRIPMDELVKYQHRLIASDRDGTHV